MISFPTTSSAEGLITNTLYDNNDDNNDDNLNSMNLSTNTNTNKTISDDKNTNHSTSNQSCLLMGDLSPDVLVVLNNQYRSQPSQPSLQSSPPSPPASPISVPSSFPSQLDLSSCSTAFTVIDYSKLIELDCQEVLSHPQAILDYQQFREDYQSQFFSEIEIKCEMPDKNWLVKRFRRSVLVMMMSHAIMELCYEYQCDVMKRT